MKLKSYFAGSVQEAIHNARTELGPEAMLVNSKATTSSQKQLGAYEVVFGITDETAPMRKSREVGSISTPPPAVAQSAPPPTAAQSDALVQEIAELRRQIIAVRESLANSNSSGANAAHPAPEFQEQHQQLVDFGLSPQMADEALRTIEGRLSQTPEELTDAIIAHLHKQFEVSPSLGSSKDRVVAMFVGPPGAGKTTTLVKLAVKYGIAQRSSLRLLSTDTLRVGGSEQLANYARIIGAGFDALDTPSALKGALEENASKKLVLIDTPGYGPSDTAEAEQLAAVVRKTADIEVHLVLPAFLTASSMSSFIERFQIFNPKKLLFTHLDEVDKLGAVLELARKSGLALSFFGTGQGIPQDLSEASKDRLTEGLITRARAMSHAAA